MSSDSLRYRWLDAIVEKEGQIGPSGPTVRHAALTLAAFMDDDGKCWPSLAMVARAMQRSRSTTVVQALDQLEQQGWIKRKRGTVGQPTIYQAVIPVVPSQALVPSERAGSPVSAPEVVPSQHRGSPVGRTRTPQEHANEHSRESREGDSVLNYPFPTEVSEAFIRTRGQRAQAEDFPTLKSIALELKAQYPPETIVEAVRTLGRSDDPPETLPAYVEAVAA